MPYHTRLDDIDVKIIRALQRDARSSFSDIASSCGVSTDTISKRFKRMKKIGIAKGTTILLDPKSFGYDCISSFGMRVNHLHIAEVVDFVEKLPEVVFCTPCMGTHDIFAIAILKDVGRLEQLKEQIKRHPEVGEVMTNIWVDEIKLCPENFEFQDQKMK